MSSPDESPRFENVDWDAVDGGRTLLTPERVTLAVGVALVAALYWYHRTVAGVYLVAEWRPAPVDWALLVGVVVLVATVVVPAVRRPATARRVWRHLRTHPVALAGGGYLAAVTVVGVLAPVLYPDPGLQFQHAYHPPVGFTNTGVDECLGNVTGGAFNETCHGSLALPLGADGRGRPLSYLLVAGARTAVYVVVVTAAFVVPLATAVGVVAGLRGGLLDDLLMGYVDLQLSLPAMLVYLVVNAYWHTSLFVLLATFGLFSWGGIARLVRSEVLQRREAGYVRVARGYGASWPTIARRHVLPNVTNTLAPAVFQLLALLVLVEAGVAFLGFHDAQSLSWGATIAGAGPSHDVWWVSTVPAVALVATVLSLKVLGDGLRDALDPRGDGQ